MTRANKFILPTRAGPVLAMFGITVVWGWTFVVVRDAVGRYPVLPFLALRFGVATAVLAPVLLRPGRGLRSGVPPGLLLAGGYLAQTIGLRYTTASKAGLLTGLLVVLTPLMGFVLLRSRPRPVTAFAAVGALVGTLLLVAPGASGSVPREALGDSLEVLTAILFSLHILALTRLSPGLDAARMAITQMSVAAIIFSSGAALTGGFPMPSASTWFAVVLTGVLASAIAFWVQTFVQQRISSDRTAIILASEPAFATFFGLVLAGDRFGVPQAAGATVILGSIALHELRLHGLRAFPVAGP